MTTKAKTVPAVSEAGTIPDGTLMYVSSRSYVTGSHTARVRAEHDARRTELLSRHDVLAAEIHVRQSEMDDISEALALMSAPAASNVVPIAPAAE